MGISGKIMKFLLLIVFLHPVVLEPDHLQPHTFPYPVSGSEIVVVIRNNLHETNIEKAKNIKASIIKQAKETNDYVVVKMLHEDWAGYGGWTIFPLIEYLFKAYSEKKWVFFCEETTKIDLKGLLAILSRHNYNEHVFLGHELYDIEPVIIHHYRFFNNPKSFKYPDFDAGWAISKGLLRHTFKRLEQKKVPDFSIDVKHEVAYYFYDEGNGTTLTNVPAFCINKPLQLGVCATTTAWEAPNCGEVGADNILVSVKTCEKFHTSRIPVVKKTVALHAKNIVYYSDIVDKTIPTEYADIKNMERGHCQKLYNILNKFITNKKWRKVPWLVVIDDDTIMNFKSLQKILACYDPKDAVVIGERYGFSVNANVHGYDYPTGGGGMVLSRPAVQQVVSSEFRCHNADDPDDMWLGAALKQLRIPITHTNSFHQALPNQYNEEFLSHRYLVSFHKHFGMDPLDVYNKYLAGNEIRKIDRVSNNQIRNDEL